MAIDFIQKQWKDFPDTSTPITATELNRLENVISEIAKGFQTQTIIAKTITQFIIHSIFAIYPEYSVSTLTETVDSEIAAQKTVRLDLNVYNPNKADGLLITLDGILVSPLAYTTTVENDTVLIEFFTSAGLEVGQTLNFYVYHKPKTGSTNITGQPLTICDGTVTEGITGIAEKIIDEEETE